MKFFAEYLRCWATLTLFVFLIAWNTNEGEVQSNKKNDTTYTTGNEEKDIINYSVNDGTIMDFLQVSQYGQNSWGQEIVDVAMKELGRGPNEVGKDVSYYPYNIDLYLDTDEAWCSEFVSWCYKVGGCPFTGNWMISGSKSLRSWFRSLRDFVDRSHLEWNTFEPAAGDYIRYENSGGGHSGIVRYVSNDTLYTVEGNVSNSVVLRARANWRNYDNIDGIGLRVVSLESYFSYKTYVDSLRVEFTDKSFSRKHPITNWEWNFGDGETSTEQNPVHIYASAGIYSVSLTTITDQGEKNTKVIALKVPKPIYNLTLNIVGEGSVEINPAGGSYENKTEITLTSSTGSSWRFEKWSYGIDNLWNPIKIQMESDRNITAVFINPGDVVGYIKAFPQISKSANRRAMPFIMSETGNIYSITMFHEAGEGRLILAVYDGNSVPQNLLGVTPETDVCESAGWQTINLTNDVLVQEGDTVWLAWIYEKIPGVRYQSGSPGRVEAGSDWSGGMPELFGNCSRSNHVYSIYANYSPVTTVDIEDDKFTPNDFVLYTAYPNPFNSSTRIKFSLPQNSTVSISVYNILGQKVFELADKNLFAGIHTLDFDASKLSSGIYFYSINAIGRNGQEFNKVMKMTLLK
ncbi:MAG: PKD domain-containing protein [Ignavibacteria bacterium]